MIYIDRTRVPRPDALSRVYRGKTEYERVIVAFDKHTRAGKSPLEFRFDFKIYKEPDVKTALHTLFKGKCAYCEARYAGTQPMDVEHWRPKGEVHLANGTIIPGYYWLASEWTNLLPSCIDCNRARDQFDVVENKVILLGKANQFPLADESKRISIHTGDPSNCGGEDPLLLNPCVDRPANHLYYNEEAVALPGPPGGSRSPKGAMSIRVYALNRTDLVLERLQVAKLIKQRAYTIERLIELLDRSAGTISDELKMVLEDLLSHEISALLEMTNPDKPFSGMATQMVTTLSQRFGAIPAPTPPGTGSPP